jgi:DNA-directed RNA polymerase specialized sigma24 family protein
LRGLFSEELIDKFQAAFEDNEEVWPAFRAGLRDCLRKQPPKILELLHWRYAYDLKPGEIAARMGITSGAVRAMLHRAREALRKCIKRHARGAIES